RQLADLRPRDARSLERYREIVGGALDVLVPPGPSTVSWQSRQTAQRDGYQETLGLLRYRSAEGHQAELPAVQLVPKSPGGRGGEGWTVPGGRHARCRGQALARRGRFRPRRGPALPGGVPGRRQTPSARSLAGRRGGVRELDLLLQPAPLCTARAGHPGARG